MAPQSIAAASRLPDAAPSDKCERPKHAWRLEAPLARDDLAHVFEHVGNSWHELRNQSIFITGGTGFVGRWLVESLLHADERLGLGVSVSLLTRDPARFRARSPHLAEQHSVQIVRGNVCDFAFPTGHSFIIHAATERAQSGVQGTLASFDSDIAGTRRVLEFARMHGVHRLLFTSSGAVYGRQPPDMANIDETYPGAPACEDLSSAYGQAKRASEFMCCAYARAYGFEAVIARLFAFVGPLLPLDENYAVGNFIGDVLSGRPVRITGDGSPYRSYLHAADLAAWLWTILLGGRSMRPYNVGSSIAMTIEQVAKVVAAGRDIEIAQRPQSGAAAARYVPSTKRAEDELGLRVWIPFHEAIARTFLWHRGKS